MKYLKTYIEKISIDIEVGDTVLGGRFKNKKILVKKIGKNKKGDITINDKPLLKFRLIKEAISAAEFKEQCETYLAYLLDDDKFNIEISRIDIDNAKYREKGYKVPDLKGNQVEIFTSNGYYGGKGSNLQVYIDVKETSIFKWGEVKDRLIPYIIMLSESEKIRIVFEYDNNNTLHNKPIPVEDIENDYDLELTRISIITNEL